MAAIHQSTLSLGQLHILEMLSRCRTQDSLERLKKTLFDYYVKEAEAEEFRKALEEADGLEFYEDRKRYTSCTAGDYSPSNPWDAPGMSIRDFI
jgi:hypothetical protein